MSTMYECVEKISMLIGCNIRIICLKLMLQLSEFVDATFFSMSRFNNFLLIGATDRSKISSDQKRLFFPVSLYPLSFFVNTPLKLMVYKLLHRCIF